MSRKIIKGTLASAVADAGTVVISYPNAEAPALAYPTDEGDFYNTMGHQMVVGQNNVATAPEQLGIGINTSGITVTNKTGSTWPAGASFTLGVEQPGGDVWAPDIDEGQAIKFARMSTARTYLINLGAPDALVTNGVMAAQNRTNAGALVVNGTLASGGVVVLDRPRTLIADSGGADTAVLTISGKDEYGVSMSEEITLNGTTAVSGKKAFKTVESISASAAVANSAFIGTANVFGLPCWLPSNGHVLKELQNGTAASAGTFVAGWNTAGAHTATGADVRGTYACAATCDGEIVLQLLVALPDVKRGVTQYAA